MKIILKPSQLEPGMHFLRRNGGWFRPKAQGYTDDIAQAGIFTTAEVMDYMKAEGVTAVPVASMKQDIWKQVRESLERAAKLSELAINL